MTALEFALAERHAARQGSGKAPAFGILLREMVGVTASDDDVPMVACCGGSVVGRLTGKVSPSLREIRNSLAHGAPFDGLPNSGLVELSRDLIEFAYREYLAEAANDLTTR